MITNKEVDYLLNSIDEIKVKVNENNIMLKQICKVINTYLAHYPKENQDDFIRNIFANVISSGIDVNKIFKRR